MMLSISLPVLPPAPSSLLPHLNLSHNDASSTSQQHAHHAHHSHPSRRPKPNLNVRSTLAVLAADERAIAQRKMAIAMYGYSWLKPAGCGKTMLGRREEEIEREEVERQLREVELQERMAAEAEEQERLARSHQQGEVVDEGERDLDDDVPEADEIGDEMDGDEGVDLDDEIPEAGESEEEGDLDGEISDIVQEPWAYDSRREPDSDDEDGVGTDGRSQGQAQRRQHQRGIPGSEYDVDEREALALANAMLDEDEMGEMDFDPSSHDHLQGEEEDDIMGAERDLDDDVPDADAEEGWEHTDTELDESEMDISILPPNPNPNAAHVRGGARRSSGIPPSSSVPRGNYTSVTDGTRVVSGNAAHYHQQQQLFQPGAQAQQHMLQTPGTVESSTNDSSSILLASSDASHLRQQRGQESQSQSTRDPQQLPPAATRNWLVSAAGGARRNLFGIGRGGTAARGNGQIVMTTGISGRLFTPSPRVPSSQSQQQRGTAAGGGDGNEMDAMATPEDGAHRSASLSSSSPLPPPPPAAPRRRSGRRRGGGGAS